MKKGFLIGLPFLLLAGCEHKQPVFTPLPREVYVGYSLDKDTLRVARLLETDGQYQLLRAALTEGQEMKQRVEPVIAVLRDSLSNAKARLQAQYIWHPYPSKYPSELFVQVDPAPKNRKETLLNIMAVMSERNTLEGAIEDDLAEHHLGTWSASDLGPGGMNMLYDVTSIDSALAVVVRTLEAHHVQGRARIARRLMTKADDWRYEVIYPVNFNGRFNHM
jgi:hypothetical protein